MAKLRDEISSLQDDVSKANDQVTIHSILVSVKITSEMRFDFVAERPSVNCLFFFLSWRIRKKLLETWKWSWPCHKKNTGHVHKR